MQLPECFAALTDEMRVWRRDFHQHPELGYKEKRTARKIAERLREFGLDAVEEGIGGTGVVGTLYGSGPRRNDPEHTIMLRADMDALPMAETSGVAHASQSEGVMHACGHDGHMTMLLGAARHLAGTRRFSGTAHFVFQPAEESGAGARAMIEDGLFTRFDARAVYGMHNWPNAPVGSFFTRTGPLLASTEEFTITITGKGGHAAQPHLCKDPIPAAAALVMSLQTIISRSLDPLGSAVVSVTQFNAGTAHNVIPGSARLAGTVRSFETSARNQILREMERMTERIAAAHDVEGRFSLSEDGYPACVNDAKETGLALEVARAIAGEDMVLGDIPPTMGGEDFAFLAQQRPGAFMLMGIGPNAPLHDTKYDFNDEAAPWGVAYWTKLVETALPLEHG